MTRLPLLEVVTVLAATLAVPGPIATAAPAPDPIAAATAAGPHDVRVVEYDAGPTVVVSAGREVWRDELRGALFVPSGDGPFPVLLFLHGVGDECEDMLRQDPAQPLDTTCGFGPRIPNHRGYDYVARNLASHGYLVASLLTHSHSSVVTAYPFTDAGAAGRAELLAQTLDKLAAWHTGPGPGDVGTSLVGRVDLTRIGAMGHSRGGEGVTKLIDHARQRVGAHYEIDAVFAIAPIDAQRLAPHGIPYAVIVPMCDGDVYELDGAYVYDRGRFVDPDEPAPRMQFAVRGANHNYFNTVWAGHDDAHGDNPACDPLSPQSVRLSRDEQQRVGLALVAGFFRRYLGGDRTFEPLMTGAVRPAPVDVSYLAPAADRVMVVTGDTTTATDAGGALRLTGFVDPVVCRPHPEREGTDPTEDLVRYPDPWFDFAGLNPPSELVYGIGRGSCPSDPTHSVAHQIVLRWDGPAALSADLAALPGGSIDASRFTAVTFRVGVNFPERGSPAPEVDVVLHDALGHASVVAASAYTSSLRSPDGSGPRSPGAQRRTSAAGRVPHRPTGPAHPGRTSVRAERPRLDPARRARPPGELSPAATRALPLPDRSSCTGLAPTRSTCARCPEPTRPRSPRSTASAARAEDALMYADYRHVVREHVYDECWLLDITWAEVEQLRRRRRGR